MSLPRRRTILALLAIGAVGWFPLQGCTCYQLKSETCEVGIQLTASGIQVKETIKLHLNQQGVRWFIKVPGVAIKVEWDPSPPSGYDNASGVPFEIQCTGAECVSNTKASRPGKFKYQITATPQGGQPIVLDPDVVVMD
jgi:hypothetical protein